MARPRASPRFPAGPTGRAPNPRATAAEHREVVRLVRRLLPELDPGGRSAVLLAGSWARGDAHTGSDVDVWVVGRRAQERHRNLERQGRLVTVRYTTAVNDRGEMRNPARLDGAVPGWRVAKVLRDPTGIAKRLKKEARAFRWDRIRRKRDAYVADQLAGWAEEVAKLLRAMETGERATAAVQRNLLANHLAMLRAMELELLRDTENGLWERTARRAGPEFGVAQAAALGTEDGSWRASCEGALRLYALTAKASLPILRGENRRIVVTACRRAGYPVEGRSSGRP